MTAIRERWLKRKSFIQKITIVSNNTLLLCTNLKHLFDHNITFLCYLNEHFSKEV